MSTLVRFIAATLSAQVVTRPRGDGYECFEAPAAPGGTHARDDWQRSVRRLEAHAPLVDTLAAADIVIANLEGTFHHHTVGALALGGALALAHRMGKPVWAVNGTVEAIEPWLLDETLRPAEYLALREPRSVRWLAAHGIHARLAADAVFLAESFCVRDMAPSLEARSVLYTPGVVAGLARSPAEARRGVFADLEALADANWHPVFLQMEDREKTLTDAVGSAGWSVADARDVAWHAFGHYLRRFALVVSGRYHVLLFAAMAGVPALALPSNTFKVEGLLDLLRRPDVLLRDPGDLRARLRRSLPRPVGEARIRQCQQLALRNVPASGEPGCTSARAVRSPAVACVEGLDWTHASALPGVLTALRRSGPDAFVTSISTAPSRVSRDGLVSLRPPGWWRRTLERAGFDVSAERLALEETGTALADGEVARRWTLANPFRDDGVGRRRVYSLRRSVAGRPEAARQRAGNLHVAFVVGSLAEFDRHLRRWSVMPSHACSVIVRRDPGDAAWSLVTEGIEARCRQAAIAVYRASRPGDVPWEALASRGLLVATEEPDAGYRRTFHAAFRAVALQRGWETAAAIGGASGALPRDVPGAGGAVTLADALGDWVDAYAARVLVSVDDISDVLGTARVRPELLFVVRPRQGSWTSARPEVIPGNVVVIDDLTWVLAGLDARQLVMSVDAVAVEPGCPMFDESVESSDTPTVTLAALARARSYPGVRRQGEPSPGPGRRDRRPSWFAMAQVKPRRTPDGCLDIPPGGCSRSPAVMSRATARPRRER